MDAVTRTQLYGGECQKRRNIKGISIVIGSERENCGGTRGDANPMGFR